MPDPDPLPDRAKAVTNALAAIPEEAFAYFVIALQSRARSVLSDHGFHPDTEAAVQALLAVTTAYFDEG